MVVTNLAAACSGCSGPTLEYVIERCRDSSSYTNQNLSFHFINDLRLIILHSNDPIQNQMKEINHEMAVGYLNRYFYNDYMHSQHHILEIILLVLQRAYSSHNGILIECGWAEQLPGHQQSNDIKSLFYFLQLLWIA